MNTPTMNTALPTTVFMLTVPTVEAKHLERLAEKKGWVCVKMASYITEDDQVKTTEQKR